MKEKEIIVIKKDGKEESFTRSKIYIAITKSANVKGIALSDAEQILVAKKTIKQIKATKNNHVKVQALHDYVINALYEVNPVVAASYKDYRDIKKEEAKIWKGIIEEADRIMLRGDKENSNRDSALCSTKQILIQHHVSKQLWRKQFFTEEELLAHDTGYIYINDLAQRKYTINCCLFDVESVLNGGFEMGNIWYNEPKSLDVAFDVIGDIVLSAASQQYGGFTVPEIDKILAKYAEMTFAELTNKYMTRCHMDQDDAMNLAYDDVERIMEQGFQGFEYKFNTVATSRGDYPFITFTFGLATDKFGKLAAATCLKTRMNGQGKEGYKMPVLFPKLVFLYDKKLHSGKGINTDLFDLGVKCTSKAMYPDWLSLTGEGYVSDIYKKYNLAISPMGCRAFLSPWFERGGMHPAADDDKPYFVGRFNIGVVSLNLPLIYLTAVRDKKDFFELLDYYLNMIRKIHLRTYDYLGELPASIDPLAFCEGGLRGHLKPNEKIKPLLASATASFGYTALEELQQAFNHKSLVEDGTFALSVLQYINAKIEDYKKQDGRLYAVYGTPAENLCGLQVKQLRSEFGVIPGVSDREYVSNSFHCHVTSKITPIQKQNLEYRFYPYSTGGEIQYVRYPIDYNTAAIKTLILRAMEMGFYEGVNMALSFCDDCGHQELNMDVCPCCGSRNLTKIDRMNGYLSYSRKNGSSYLSVHKMKEIEQRVSC